MNHVFRIVWSRALSTWVVASESTAQRGKSGRDSRRCQALLAGVGVVAAALCGWSSPASAQTWTGTTSSDWTVGSNWSTGTVPTGNVTISTSTPNPTVLGVSGPATAAMGILTMGATASGTSVLTIQNGSTLTSVAAGTNVIGQANGANATITVTGLGSAWSTAGSTIMGNGSGATATLNIANGAAVSIANSLTLGQSGVVSGNAVLNITSGGTLTTTGNATMFRRGGNSTANVSGAGSQWSVGGSLMVGTGATGGSSGISVLNVDNGGVVTVAGPVGIGGASLSTRGLGALTLTGAGSQLSSGGALNIGQWGTGTLTVSNGAVATANTVTLGASASGSGTLNLVGGSTLASQALTGGSGLMRQVNFDGGTLRATASNTAFISGFSGTELNVAAGGLTLDTAGFDVTAASPFSGVGALIKTGLGTAVLTGDNSYTGGTTISSGTLQLGNGGSSGSITGDVTNNGTLAFNRSDAYTYGGQIAGTGAVDQIGTGTTILTGNNTYAGGTSINGGTLQVASDANLGNASGPLSFNGGTLQNTTSFSSARAVTLGAGGGTLRTDADLTYSGLIGGVGALTKTGAGALVLTGNNAAYAGGTTVEAGTLAVNGTLGGTLNVLGAGRLQGTGTVGSTTLAGTIAPGNSIGTLTVNGNYTQAPGSTYEVEVDPASTASDLIHATGVASIGSGARLNVVRINSGAYTVGNRYTVLTADGGVTGTYSLAGDTSLAFVRLVDSYDANNVYLSAEKVRSIADAAGTSNQAAVGAALDSLPSTNSLANAVTWLPNDFAARDALNQLSADIHASTKTALLEDSRFVREAAIDRLRGAACAPGSAANSPTQTPQQAGAGCTPEDRQKHSAWTHMFGSWGSIDSDGNAAKLKRDIGGFVVGADTGVGAGWRVGALGGYSRASADTSARNSSSKTDSYHLGAYGGTQWGSTALRLGATQSWNKTEANRSVAFAGFAGALDAEYDSTTTQVFGELGHQIDLGRATLEPFAGLAHVRLKSDAFLERGGPAAMYGEGDSTNATFSTIGLRASIQASERIRVRGMLAWRHAFGDTSPATTHTFSGSLPFTLAGVPLAKDVAVLEAGLETRLRPNLTLGASYAGQFGDGLEDHGFKASLNWKF